MTGKNSVGTTAKLASNTDILLGKLIDPNTTTVPSKYKEYKPPSSSPLGAKVKNGSVGTLNQVRRLFEAGYVFIVPINYFVKWGDDLTELLARHAQKNGATDTRSWLINLLIQVNPAVLDRQPRMLIVMPDNSGGIDGAVNVIKTMSGNQAVVKASHRELSQRALLNITNSIMFVTAPRESIVTRTTSASLHPNDQAALELLHPASTNKSKTLVQKLQDKLLEIQKVSGFTGFAKAYSIKVSPNKDNASNYTVTMNSGEGKHDVGRRVTKTGMERWTVLLGEMNNNKVYVTIGSDIANNMATQNLIATQVQGVFSNLPANLAQVKVNVAQSSVPGYSQSQASIAMNNAQDAADAFSRSQPPQFNVGNLPAPGQSFVQSSVPSYVPPPQPQPQVFPEQQQQFGEVPFVNQQILSDQDFGLPEEGGDTQFTGVGEDFSQVPGGLDFNPLAQPPADQFVNPPPQSEQFVNPPAPLASAQPELAASNSEFDF